MVAAPADGGIEKPVRSVFGHRMTRDEFRSPVCLEAAHLRKHVDHPPSDEPVIAIAPGPHEIGAQYFGQRRLPLLLPVFASRQTAAQPGKSAQRSEERRVGKECRSRWAP